jgi:hypothetical protein
MHVGRREGKSEPYHYFCYFGVGLDEGLLEELGG